MQHEPVFRSALPREARAVFDLIMERVAWMDRVGIHQWNDTRYDQRYPLTYYRQKALAGELFVLEAGTQLLCVGALFHEDARWPEAANARYLHHFAARVGEKGAGSIFLEKAERYAREQGAEYMRLDSAVGNQTLQRYYTARGYTECGKCEDGLYKGILRQKKL